MSLTCLKPRLLFFLILFSGGLIFAQPNGKDFIFSGRIIDSTTKVPISFVHIYNENKGLAFIAESNGTFSFSASVGDTLAIMAMGYFSRKHIIKKRDSIYFALILLNQQAYDIEGVRVNFPLTYQEFKKAFLDLDIQKEKPRPMPELPVYNPYKIPELIDTNNIHSAGFYLASPITALYLKNNKEEISKRKVWYLKQQELRQVEVDKKYNRELVREITGFNNDELLSFMGFCDFSFNYLYKSTPLEIVEAIYDQYYIYLACCVKKENTNNQK